MVKTKHKNIKMWGLVAVLSLGLIGFLVNSTVSAYTCKEGDTKCEEAKNNMQENQSAASDFAKKANSVGEIIQQLDNEIADLNRTIAENELKVKRLNKEIEKTEKKLIEEQSALAELLVNMHFESDAEPIRILAGSTSISDLAEKAAREEVVKQEIATASEKVKTAKEQLNKEKGEVEATLKENEENRAALATRKADQRELKETYEKNADEATTVAAYWEKQFQALAWTPPSNSTGSGSRWHGTNNYYPYRDNCPQDNVAYSAYGGAVCQCTSYASYKAQATFGVVNVWGGHAKTYTRVGDMDWISAGYDKYNVHVPSTGFRVYVDRSPAPNTMAIQTSGIYGHVMWVESVNGDGSVNVTEYNVNWPSIGCYPGDFCSRSNVGSYDMYFMHFE